MQTRSLCDEWALLRHPIPLCRCHASDRDIKCLELKG